MRITVKILFHAVNGVGLGHVARLSWVARYLRAVSPKLSCAAVSSSPLARQWFAPPCDHVPCDLLEPDAHVEGVRAVVERIDPDVVVFDTRWPAGVPEWLAARGVRRILVLRAQAPDRMTRVATEAASRFDAVLLPHTPDELRFYYDADLTLSTLLGTTPFDAVGPIARVDDGGRARPAAVLFTVGAGGNYLAGLKRTDEVAALVELYADAAALLRARGIERLDLVVGPMLPPLDLPRVAPLGAVRRLDCHVLMSPNTVVVSRGGYNTSWEAIAAAAKLVVASSQSAVEDVEARCRYFAARGFAIHACLSPEAIVDAIVGPAAPNTHVGRALVNRGLPAIARAITG